MRTISLHRIPLQVQAHQEGQFGDACHIGQVMNLVLIQRQSLKREQSIQATSGRYFIARQYQLRYIADVHEDVVQAELQLQRAKRFTGEGNFRDISIGEWQT